MDLDVERSTGAVVAVGRPTAAAAAAMIHALAALGAVACLLLAGRLTWAMLRQPARQWECRWVDGNDPQRGRVCSGAKSVTGPVRYRHHHPDGSCGYVGQAVDFVSRMRVERKEMMTSYFEWSVVESVPRRPTRKWQKLILDRAEAEWIDQYRPDLNRTRGNRRKKNRNT